MDPPPSSSEASNPYRDRNATPSNLPSTISLLQDLASLAESTLKSVTEFLSSDLPSLSSSSLVCCPYDSRHRMPPESLFRHSLSCPSALGSRLFDIGFLENLLYIRSLKSEDQLLKENPFVRPLPEAEADLCFSLDGELGHIGSNFFYKDCPGVVTTPEPDVTSRTFTLPPILSSECANFITEHGEGGGDLDQKLGILPSELWTLRSEVEAWTNFPASYSYAVLRVAVGLEWSDELSLKRWIISNSPHFGIVIDEAMMDHVFLLMKLCLKAVKREAVSSLGLVLQKNGFLDPRVVTFECPRLVSSMIWLWSQIAVLYGEASGKFFIIRMLKESFLQVGRSLMSFKTKREKVASDCDMSVSGSESCDMESKLSLSKSVANLEIEGHKASKNFRIHKVFVSQVAAAIAALQERFILEQRLKAHRFTQPLPKFQLINEYMSTTIRASQERGKRPNYRPLLEHDGLLWQRPKNQAFGKSKTREELLAEERDYKRRRMSYRGKKVKRNHVQVLHDIIEEHMEEIKQAGGIGCNIKTSSDSSLFPDFGSDTNKDHALQNNPSRTTHGYDSTSDGSIISSLPKTLQEPRYERYEDHYRLKNSKSEMDKYRVGHSHPKDQSIRRPSRERLAGYDHPLRYQDHNNRSTYASRTHADSKYNDRYIKEYRRNGGREPAGQDAFEDRYEPSPPHDVYETQITKASQPRKCHPASWHGT